MKNAKYGDYKRSLLKKWTKGSHILKEVSLKNIFNWKDATLKINHPVTLITGKNGTGKSTFINILKHIYQLQNGNEELGILSNIKDYEVKLVNRTGREIVIKNQKFVKKEFSIPYIKDLTFNSALYSFFKNSTGDNMFNYIETLNQYDVKLLSGNLLSLLRELIGKDIVSSEKIIDEEEPSKEYYKLKLRDGTSYDSYTMGAGEFYINQFIWGLENIPNESLVLIEELENFLHGEAQKKILELIHEYALKKNIQFILTTHSPILIDHSTLSSKILIKIDINTNIICINDCSNWLAKDILGVGIQNKVEILVEDEKSANFIHGVLSVLYPDILKKIIITPVDGDNNVKKFVEMNNLLKTSKILGIIDSDSDLLESENLIKFPGANCPEKTVINYVTNHLDKLSPRIDRHIDEIKISFENIKTLNDHHEWVTRIASELGQNNDFLWISLVKIWVNDNKESEDLKRFFVNFEKIINKLEKIE